MDLTTTHVRRKYRIEFICLGLLLAGLITACSGTDSRTAGLPTDTPPSQSDPVAGSATASGLVATATPTSDPVNVARLATPVVVTPTQSLDYLPNPGIGWQEGRTFDQPLLPETVAYRRPQYNWNTQNPEEDVFDWSAVDADLAAAEAQGKQFSFRIYTMRGEPFGGHQIPQWVLDKGAVILPSGEPDYSNCVYQAEWARFVEAMRYRYDGRPGIAFIDISGYGNFNEWSWHEQTQWEEETLDAQARQRLADIFIGGQGEIQCRTADGSLETVAYDYLGFRETQLLMPYAGVQKSTRYVAGRRPDVGIRHDCLGEADYTTDMLDKIGDVISQTWRSAPVVYEFCAGRTTDPDYIAVADAVLKQTHGSLVHDNLVGERDVAVLTDLLKFAGYRFVLDRVTHPAGVEPGGAVEVEMMWRNTGYAPVYPRMGQNFELHFYLVGSDGAVAQDWRIEADIAAWLPADPTSGSPPEQLIEQTLPVPTTLSPGRYTTTVAIIDTRTGQPINLAIEGRDAQGRYPLGEVVIINQ